MKLHRTSFVVRSKEEYFPASLNYNAAYSSHLLLLSNNYGYYLAYWPLHT